MAVVAKEEEVGYKIVTRAKEVVKASWVNKKDRLSLLSVLSRNDPCNGEV